MSPSDPHKPERLDKPLDALGEDTAEACADEASSKKDSESSGIDKTVEKVAKTTKSARDKTTKSAGYAQELVSELRSDSPDAATLALAPLKALEQAPGGTGGAAALLRQAIEGAVHLAERANKSDKLRYKVEVDGEPERTWLVRAVRGEETLSRPYALRLEIVTKDMARRPETLLGKACSLTLEHKPHIRCIHGILRRVQLGHNLADHLLVEVELVPALALLDIGCRSRVFQQLTAVEVALEVLKAGLAPFGREVSVSGDWHEDRDRFPVFETLTQYQESDLAFAERLLESAGVHYAFRQGASSEEVLLLNPEGDLDAVFEGEGPLLPYAPGRQETRGSQPVYALQHATSLCADEVTVRGWDFTRPSAPIERVLELENLAPSGRSHCLNDAVRPTAFDEDAAAYASDTGQVAAQHLGRTLQQKSQCYRGESLIAHMAPGHIFELRGHPVPSLNGTYVLTSVEHVGAAAELQALGEGDIAGGELYHNRFGCLPGSALPTPEPRRPRPVIAGLQTAVVTCPSGEEIHCDDFGRVRVRFPWDSAASPDGETSAWVRVMQNWAGAGAGAFFVPRAGMEVVVSFLEGDPDRPLITGAVYNAANPPPYRLSEEKTRSGWRSTSSPDGKVINEIAFEDSAGREALELQAGRNLHTQVSADSRTAVQGSVTTTVGGTSTLGVKGNVSITVGDDDKHGASWLTAMASEGIEASVGQAAYHHVKEGVSLAYAGDTQIDAWESGIRLQFKKHKLLIDGDGIVIKFNDDEGESIRLDAAGIHLNSKCIEVNSTGGSTLKLDDAAVLQRGGTTGVWVSDETTALKSSGEVTISAAGGSSGTFSGSGVELDGTQIKLNG